MEQCVAIKRTNKVEMDRVIMFILKYFDGPNNERSMIFGNFGMCNVLVLGN